MWQPAVVRFGAFALVVSACWRSTAPESPIGNQARGGERDLAGDYYCSIQNDEYRYPRFPCVVRRTDGRITLEKLGGSQRFRGEVTPRGDGFAFAGELYCPWGDCTQPLHGVFEPVGEGRYRARFEDGRRIVLLERAPDGAFGGAGYGGAAYGGAVYGGASYGGWGHGGMPLAPRDRRGP